MQQRHNAFAEDEDEAEEEVQTVFLSRLPVCLPLLLLACVHVGCWRLCMFMSHAKTDCMGMHVHEDEQVRGCMCEAV